MSSGVKLAELKSTDESSGCARPDKLLFRKLRSDILNFLGIHIRTFWGLSL